MAHTSTPDKTDVELMDQVPAFARGHQLGKLARHIEFPEEANGDTVEVLAAEGDYEADTEFVDTPEGAEVILSLSGNTRRTVNSWGAEHEANLHRPVLDLDFPAALVPSSTPGHFHLYLDKEMTWSDYKYLICAFETVGLIEKGYKEASLAREFTSVRLPWVKKADRDEAEGK